VGDLVGHAAGGDPGLTADDRDVTRRTFLAAERTWLAWWRTGIATAGVAVAVGGVAPHLVQSTKGLYIALGAGYAALAMAVFLAAGLRQRQVGRALDDGGYADLSGLWLVWMTVAGAALALGTLAALLISA
jgi:inner membrane protein YidH